MDCWQPTLELKLKVTVVLLGLNGEYPVDDSLVVRPETLAATLEELFPSFHPPVVPSPPTSQGGGTEAPEYVTPSRAELISPLKVRYDVSYVVRHTGSNAHGEYLEALANAAEVDTTRADGDYRPLLVPIDAISNAVESIALEEAGMAPVPADPTFGNTEVTILVANPSRTGLVERLHSRGKQNPTIEAAKGDIRRKGEYSFVEPGNLHRVKPRAGPAWEDRGDTKERSSTCARSWVGQGRVLIVDLGAVACGYGALREVESRSTVAETMFPSGSAQGNSGHWLHDNGRSHQGVGGESAGRGSVASDPATIFNLKLSSLVVSAIRTTLAPAVPAYPGPGDTSELVVVPLLVFRGDGDGSGSETDDPATAEVSPTLREVVDVAQVSEAVSAMALPQQEVLVVGAVHLFRDHPQVAIALEKSLATNSRFHLSAGRNHIQPSLELHQEGYVDSQKLLAEMKSAGDTLASSLMSDLGENRLLRLDVALAAQGKQRDLPRLHGARVRVLPVFVFCLGGVDEASFDHSTSSEIAGSASEAIGHNQAEKLPAQLFEGSSPFAAEVGGEAVLVLQSEGSAPIPFYERQGLLRMPLSDATQAVAAGLLRSMHGMTAPDHWWSSEEEYAGLDLSWAHGYHPFAPFGFGGSEPGEIFVDIARRNAVASRAAAAAAMLENAARVLENFAQALLPSELLVVGTQTVLCESGAAMKENWGRAFETAAAVACLPSHLIHPTVEVHRLLHNTVVAFEEQIKTARGTRLLEAVAAMDRARNASMSIVVQATDVGKELDWCQCTTARVGHPSHVPWILYLGALSAIFYGLGCVVVLARRGLLRYVGSSGPRR